MSVSILDVGDAKVSQTGQVLPLPLPPVGITGVGQKTDYKENKHLIPWGGTGQRGLL